MTTRLDDSEWLQAAYTTRSLQSIADELGVHRNTVRNACIRLGIARRRPGTHFKGVAKTDEQRSKMSAARKAYWEAHPADDEFKLKIGQTKTRSGIKNGYRWIYVPGMGQVAEHRYLMEKLLDRPLLPTEHVHHKDGNTLNNSVANLEVLTDVEHARHHHTSRERDISGRYV